MASTVSVSPAGSTLGIRKEAPVNHIVERLQKQARTAESSPVSFHNTPNGNNGYVEHKHDDTCNCMCHSPGSSSPSPSPALHGSSSSTSLSSQDMTESPVIGGTHLTVTGSPLIGGGKSPKPKVYHARVVTPDSFEAEQHFYPRVLNASLHPMVSSFMSLENATIAQRYCHLHPKVDVKRLMSLLESVPKQFRWAGADLFHVTNLSAQRQMIVIETNSCPSGQKSFPQAEHNEHGDGYHLLMRSTFKPLVESSKDLPQGGLAVIYDKNVMETSGYAAAMADAFKEPVYLVEFYETDTNPPVKFVDGVMYVRDVHEMWHPIRACFRYVTQRPWNRIPLCTKTLILNPIQACLAGGRNKMAADKAYEFFNKEIGISSGLKIRTPQTLRDISKHEIPLWVRSMGGKAVVKIPYSNAGQGVYTITSEQELQNFMNDPDNMRYDKYIVQSLVGNSTWSSISSDGGQYYHAGTIPNRKGHSFVSDLRMMIMGTSSGYRPIAIYARRAAKPLATELTSNDDSWAMLGTNLSVKTAEGAWNTETERLLLMDMKDFNKLGLGIDDLIDGYVQTVMATIAIDQMAQNLIKEDGTFDWTLYASLNSDQALLNEILH